MSFSVFSRKNGRRSCRVFHLLPLAPGPSGTMSCFVSGTEQTQCQRASPSCLPHAGIRAHLASSRHSGNRNVCPGTKQHPCKLQRSGGTAVTASAIQSTLLLCHKFSLQAQKASIPRNSSVLCKVKGRCVNCSSSSACSMEGFANTHTHLQAS